MAGLVAEVDGAGSVVLPFARRCRNAETTNIPVEFRLSTAFLIFFIDSWTQENGSLRGESFALQTRSFCCIKMLLGEFFCTAIVLGDKMQRGKREKKIRKAVCWEYSLVLTIVPNRSSERNVTPYRLSDKRPTFCSESFFFTFQCRMLAARLDGRKLLSHSSWKCCCWCVWVCCL